jgi:hypothetical protein
MKGIWKFKFVSFLICSKNLIRIHGSIEDLPVTADQYHTSLLQCVQYHPVRTTAIQTTRRSSSAPPDGTGQAACATVSATGPSVPALEPTSLGETAWCCVSLLDLLGPATRADAQKGKRIFYQIPMTRTTSLIGVWTSKLNRSSAQSEMIFSWTIEQHRHLKSR